MKKSNVEPKLKLVKSTEERLSEKPKTLLGQNLARLMKATKVTFEQLSANTGIPVVTLKKIKLDAGANPTIGSLLPIANFFNLTIGQLVGTEELPPDELLGNINQKKEYWRKVPIIEWSSLTSQTAAGKHSNIIYFRNIFVDVDVSQKTFGVIISEDKWPGILNNSVLIVDPEKEITNRCFAIFTKKDFKEAVLKEIIYHGDTIYLKSTNPEFKTVELDSSYQLIGVVVQTRCDFET